MRNARVLTMLLAAGLAFSGPLVANAKGKGGGGESQKGGLPALEDRVDAADALITTLQGQVLDLQGQNNWAVIDGTTVPGTPTVVRSNPAGVTVSLVSTGVYEVTFTKDVSGCAYTATIGSAAHAVPTQGQISVSGDEDADNVNDVFVHTFDVTGATPTDNSFHLNVSCP